MSKPFNIDWEFKLAVKGKCTGVGCPIKKQCERFTAKEMDIKYGFIKPPHDSSGLFPPLCINFMSNAAHKPQVRTVEIQD